MSQAPVTACLLVIGNEILSGRTRDANLAFIGERLNLLGIRLMEARVIPDVEQTIVATVNQVRGNFDYVFTTGGIGPTHDDITAECIAKAFAVPLIRNSEALALMEAHYPPGHLNEARLRMTNTPEGATLIDNPVSTAPGFQIGNVFVMAGIPTIMQAMFESLTHRLVGGAPLLSDSIEVELPEGLLAKGMGETEARFEGVEIGSYPFYRDGRPGVRIVVRSIDDGQLQAAKSRLADLIRELSGEPARDSR